MTKSEIRRHIKEYVGTNYYFLENFLDGGYEEYVDKNIRKIAMRKVYGREVKRSEYENIYSSYALKEKVLEYCKDTLKYIKSQTQ